jgi:protein-tyrosine phosphatase
MAQALLASARPDLRVTSAGTDALVGEQADGAAIALMAARGLDIGGHRARQISRAMCQEADVILVMDHQQRRVLEHQYPLATGKVFRLGEYSRSDVPDPYRKSMEMFKYSLDLIDSGVNAWVSRLDRL